MKDNITKITILTVMLLTILGVIGFSYAYFSTDVNGEGKYITLDTAELKLRYTDDVTMSLTNAIPGDKIERVFTVENIGTKTVSYNIVWKDLINTINNYDLHLDMKCKSYKNYGKSNQEEYGICDSFYKAVPTTETSISKDIRRDIEIEVGVTQVYNVTITFVNRNYSQKDNLNKSFSGKIALEEYIDNTVYCTFDGDVTTGAEYVNGDYTYKYNRSGTIISTGFIWSNEGVTADGWGATLTDKDSTNPVTSDLCTYINGKPVIYMGSMFYGSKAKSIDLSSFNTKNVINMESMFRGSSVTTIDVSNFNTKNVTDMSGLFYESNATKIIGLDQFDTRNVENMRTMFYTTVVPEIDVTSFDTSKVAAFNSMFSNSVVKVLDVSNFNTSNAVNMRYFFGRTNITNLDLSNFNTNNVTDITGMFYNSKFNEIKLNNFNTSKVTSMESLFSGSIATDIDYSNFDTSNVTNMSYMFYETKVSRLDLSKFDTSNVTNMHGMFSHTSAADIDYSSFDTSKVTDMSYMFSFVPVNVLDLSMFNTSNVTNSEGMFYGSNSLKTVYVSNKFDINKVTTSDYMFEGCSNLVGGKGTKYNSSYIDKTYARIDEGTSSPGYFTAK